MNTAKNTFHLPVIFVCSFNQLAPRIKICSFDEGSIPSTNGFGFFRHLGAKTLAKYIRKFCSSSNSSYCFSNGSQLCGVGRLGRLRQVTPLSYLQPARFLQSERLEWKGAQEVTSFTLSYTSSTSPIFTLF